MNHQLISKYKKLKTFLKNLLFRITKGEKDSRKQLRSMLHNKKIGERFQIFQKWLQFLRHRIREAIIHLRVIENTNNLFIEIFNKERLMLPVLLELDSSLHNLHVQIYLKECLSLAQIYRNITLLWDRELGHRSMKYFQIPIRQSVISLFPTFKVRFKRTIWSANNEKMFQRTE